MKRTLTKILLCALTTIVLSAIASAQNSGRMILSKNLNGTVTRSQVELTLTSNAQCDQTPGFIPDGSRIVSQSFELNADNNGVGTFQGTAVIITPDGRVLLQGQLRGTVGFNSRCNANGDCRQPWHLEGLFETSPSTYERLIARSTTDIRVAMMMLNFSADLNNQAASPLPIYNGRLEGLVPSLPAATNKISIAPDKSGYSYNELITAIIGNASEEIIQTFDLKSFCTIVQLQILDGNQWIDIGSCPLKRPSLPVNVLPNQQLIVQLLPSDTIPAPKPATYRLALSFKFLENNIPISDSYTVFSAPFVVAPLPPTNTVSLKTSQSSYLDAESIIARLNNDTDQAITTTDHKSFCSILNLQKQESGGWVNVAPCLLLTPTRMFRVNAREELTLKLPSEDASPKLTQGTYRLEFSYLMMGDNGQPASNEVKIYSASFTITQRD